MVSKICDYSPTNIIVDKVSKQRAPILGFMLMNKTLSQNFGKNVHRILEKCLEVNKAG